MILRRVFFFSSLIILSFFNILVEGKFTNLDKSKFEAGKTEFESMQSKSEFPNYGYCWKETIILLTKDCTQLTAEVQGKLALAYLNCFLQMQDLPVYECDTTRKLSECTERMKDSDRGSMATFFTQTQNICYFLEAQVWHDETERTIKRLATSSEDVATQLEETSKIQKAMRHQQKESMSKQKEILEKSINLSNIISTSSDHMHKLFDEYKNATNEQRLLIGDLFDSVSHLQSMMFGEFTGLYSILYYAVMVLMSYFLTSSPRTAAARFWLFGVATVNILSERFAIAWLISEENQLAGSGSDIDEAVYMYQKVFRNISGAVALLVLVISAYCYKDLHVLNNQLLQDIKKQIENLKIENSVLQYNENQEFESVVSLDSSSDTILREYNSNTDRPNTLTEAADSVPPSPHDNTPAMEIDEIITMWSPLVKSFDVSQSVEPTKTKKIPDFTDYPGDTFNDLYASFTTLNRGLNVKEIFEVIMNADKYPNCDSVPQYVQKPAAFIINMEKLKGQGYIREDGSGLWQFRNKAKNRYRIDQTGKLQLMVTTAKVTNKSSYELWRTYSLHKKKSNFRRLIIEIPGYPHAIFQFYFTEPVIRKSQHAALYRREATSILKRMTELRKSTTLAKSIDNK